MIIKYVQISLFRSLPRTAIAFTQGQHFVKSQSRYQDSIFVEGAERFFNVFDEISPLYTIFTRCRNSAIVSIIVGEIMILIYHAVSCLIF